METIPTRPFPAKLNRILPHFDLDEEGFCQVLSATGAFVAGGSCLAAFLGTALQEGQDMDIWLPTPRIPQTNQSTTYSFEAAAIMALHFYLKSRGYDRKKHPQREDVACDYELKSMVNPFKTMIYRIHNYIKKDIKIQVIECYDVSIADVLSTFDLNICKFYATAPSTKNSTDLFLHHPDETDAKRILEIQCRIMRPVPNSTYSTESHITLHRIAKYQSRGFTFQPDEKKEYSFPSLI